MTTTPAGNDSRPSPPNRRPIAVDVIPSIAAPVDGDAAADRFVSMALAQLGFRMIGSGQPILTRE